ncbi:MAG: hypothetical protein KF696_00475 [Planctomycetes bacterium]|nr:hypothetical protein [Planctomycetota bacterium]MCW8134586.1 hypothetical protein [Planctomycetota bacterium]
MTRWLLVVLLCATPLCAEYESNFGRVILSQCDLIVQGVAAAKRTRVVGGTKAELTVQSVLYGETKLREISAFYTDANLLKKDEAVRAMFALKKMADSGYSIVGKPVLTPESEPESVAKVDVCKAFVALERQEQGSERTGAFWDLLIAHIRQGGYPAQNAAVELMYIARDRGSIITEERFQQVQDARADARKALLRQTQDDLALASQGMVEARVKTLKVTRIRRGEKQQDRRDAADELAKLVETYPRAFTESDAKLLDATAAESDDARLKDKLAEISKRIMHEVRMREARNKPDAPRD